MPPDRSRPRKMPRWPLRPCAVSRRQRPFPDGICGFTNFQLRRSGFSAQRGRPNLPADAPLPENLKQRSEFLEIGHGNEDFGDLGGFPPLDAAGDELTGVPLDMSQNAEHSSLQHHSFSVPFLEHGYSSLDEAAEAWQQQHQLQHAVDLAAAIDPSEYIELGDLRPMAFDEDVSAFSDGDSRSTTPRRATQTVPESKSDRKSVSLLLAKAARLRSSIDGTESTKPTKPKATIPNSGRFFVKLKNKKGGAQKQSDTIGSESSTPTQEIGLVSTQSDYDSSFSIGKQDQKWTFIEEKPS